ncbi:MAG: V-type ATP synthase subunit F [Bacilli bacterium]|jgi:V/A-type H+-transporting ATPase subunit F|nr:V-type ATP synthase subunit F [Bacilli bacterium]NLN80425.1 hypothetical protein [Erysipelotrichia bacterium]
MENKVLVISKTENVYLFKSFGFDVFLVVDEDILLKHMNEFIKTKQIIIIDERLQHHFEDVRKRLSDKSFPIIIALAIDQDPSGEGLEKLRKDVERAIGLKLF